MNNNMRKTLLVIIAVAVLVGGGAFYGGMKYAQGRTSRARQAGMANLGGFRGGANGTNSANGNFTAGDIIAKDASSITVKLRDGSSKIVFYSDTTEIGKFVNGTQNDLVIGQTVSVNGIANADGSITSQSIQIRPNMPTPSPSK